MTSDEREVLREITGEIAELRGTVTAEHAITRGQVLSLQNESKRHTEAIQALTHGGSELAQENKGRIDDHDKKITRIIIAVALLVLGGGGAGAVVRFLL